MLIIICLPKNVLNLLHCIFNFKRMPQRRQLVWSCTPNARPSLWTAPALLWSVPAVWAAAATSPPTTRRRHTAPPARPCTPHPAAVRRCTARRPRCMMDHARHTMGAWPPAMERMDQGHLADPALGILLLGMYRYLLWCHSRNVGKFKARVVDPDPGCIRI
jgi:hypothetical protein